MMQTLLELLRNRVVRNPPPKLRVAVLIVAVLAYGTSGFLYFEIPTKPELGWLDGLWWTLVTMTTIGYGDYFPTTMGGRFLVAVPIMVFGIGLLGYVLSQAATALVEAKNRELRGMKDLELEDHIVIVNDPGGSKVARIVDELRADSSIGSSVEIVLIDDTHQELPLELVKRELRFVHGHPARDETLRRASIDDARKAIILARPMDPRTDDLVLAVTLAIEARAKKVRTIAECIDPGTEELLRKAGCDNIICTARFDAHFISSEVSNPGVHEVIDELLSNLHGQQLYFTKIEMTSALTYGRIVAACRRHAHLAIGIRRGHTTSLNVDDAFILQAGDEVVTIGGKRIDVIRDA
jgi:voltage-gated potassium channel